MTEASYNPAASAKTEYLLAALRCARLRIQLLANEVDEVGVALRYGIVTADGAMSWLREIGADTFLLAPTIDQGNAAVGSMPEENIHRVRSDTPRP
jgi:hypothetical protein